MEIPLAAQRLAATIRYAAVICLGAVIRGETTHDQHINRGVSLAITKSASKPASPCCSACSPVRQWNRPSPAPAATTETRAPCAEAALHMAALLKNLP